MATCLNCPNQVLEGHLFCSDDCRRHYQVQHPQDMELCSAVHPETTLASPPLCHAEGPLPDGKRHRCSMSVGHYGLHRCYCEQPFAA